MWSPRIRGISRTDWERPWEWVRFEVEVTVSRERSGTEDWSLRRLMGTGCDRAEVWEGMSDLKLWWVWPSS